jgi:uncharacterized repeat protein (TIGR03803 family)
MLGDPKNQPPVTRTPFRGAGAQKPVPLLPFVSALALCLCLARSVEAVQVQVLCSFFGATGNSPTGNFVQTPDGTFCGTTFSGGTNGGHGTVFKVTTNGVLTSLASFNSTNGDGPRGLTLGTDGNLYGTTSNGGTNGGYGTVFRVTTNGVLTSLASFNSTNGIAPNGLTLGPDGNFYGTTELGGTNGTGYGTVFRVTTNGVLTSLASFNLANGGFPHSRLTLAPDGNFYGTAEQGGSGGSIFRITTNGVLTPVFLLNYYYNGETPYSALTVGPDGNLYGTTSLGGTYGHGTVFKVTTNGVLTTLASFDGYHGMNPRAQLVLGPDGNFYGTTVNGGLWFNGYNGYGTVFRMTTNGVLTTLIYFDTWNGYCPGELAFGADGLLYGVTSGGGFGQGNFYRLVNPSAPRDFLLRKTGLNQFTAELTGTPNCIYQLQTTTNLTPPFQWQTIVSGTTDTNGGWSVTVTNSTDVPQRFYRAYAN